MVNFERLEEKHLPAIAALWNGQLGDSFPMRQRLLLQNIMKDPLLLREGSWIAMESGDDGAAGFVVAKIASEQAASYGISPQSGWIHAMVVDAGKRGRGIGQALLDKAEHALREAGAKRIALGNDLHRRLFPGIPDELKETKRWFESRGYEFREHAHDLIHVYSANEQSALPDTGDAVIRLAEPGDRAALGEFMRRCFPGTWDYQHSDYWMNGGTGREYVLIEKNNAIIGFCRINDGQSPLLAQNIYWSPLYADEMGGIGPLGIDESYRGHRYGISIVQAAIHFLLQRGVRRMVIDTTPFVDFYGKLGYTRWKSYAKYEKRLRE